MDKQKELLMNQTYRQFMDAGLGINSSAILDGIIDNKIMGLGTTADEKILNFNQLKELLKRQKEQSKDIQLHWEIKPISHYTSADENTAFFADDLFMHANMSGEAIQMYLRFSVILNYVNDKWKVIHWHGSKPENVQSKEDTFGIENWKQKAEALEKLVEERTADLHEKNHELEIEAALERVRAVAMSMMKPEDMLEVCRFISMELEKHGVKEIRNVQTAIFYESKGAYMNYEYYAKHDKAIVTETTYTNHELHKAFADQMLKGKGQCFSTNISSKELPGWIAYQKTTNVFIDEYLNTASSLNYHWHSLGPVALGISTYAPLGGESIGLFNRFLKVFELAYRRYQDIEQANAQAREAMIEAALERVRSRSMAMHSSNEVLDVITELATQLIQLGFAIDTANFNTDYRSKDWNIWTFIAAMPAPIRVHIPYFDHPIFNRVIDGLEKGEDFMTGVLTKKEKDLFFDHLYTNTNFRNVPIEGRQEAYSKKGMAWSLTFAKHTALTIVNHDAIAYSDEQNAILRRFGNVFEQSYTRFLDLQKAEAQSREARIELGLERVRARAMAMQNSEELNELIGTVFTELTKLDFVLTRCLIMIYDTKTNDARWWMANSEAADQPMNFLVKYHELPPNLAYFQAWQNRTLKFEYILQGELKKEWDDFLFSETELSLLPDFVIAGMRAPDRVYLNASFNNFGNLTLATLEPLSNEHFDILLRFAKVFDLTYTRFNDLKLAEAQAREAQIEAALERVRSRTMAMHKSSELTETAELLFDQVKHLGAELQGVAFAICNKNSLMVQKWTSIGVFSHPYNIEPGEQRMYEAWENQAAMYEEVYEGEKQKNYYEEFMKIPAFKEGLQKFIDAGYPIPTWQKNHAVTFRYGYVLFITTKPFNETQIFLRFGKVFEQTYTRFLDLQKAESQAKESQIQLALERVRARTMAMQKSDELQETSLMLFQQLKELGEPAEQLSIGIMNEAENFVEISATLDGKKFQTTFHHSGDEPFIMSKIIKAWKAQQKSLIIEQSTEELEAYNKYRNALTNSVTFPTQLEHGEKRFLYVAFFSKGMLGLSTSHSRPKESLELLERFAAVFDLTYTRFNDLKQAEAQAREAQIEAALERVRSKSMAMHKSADLLDVIKTLGDQFQLLGFKIHSANFNTSYRQKDWNLWLYNPGLPIYPEQVHVPYLDHPFFNRTLERIANGCDFNAFVFTKEEKDSFLDHLYSNTIARNAPEERKRFTYDAKGFAWSAVYLKNTALTIANYDAEPYTEEQNAIIRRFGNAFEQTYTRFLDLQKAEAQAKEAKIEASLERVRSKTMAMHNSHDVSAATAIMFNELVNLGVENMRCGVAILKHDSDLMDVWTATVTKEGHDIKGGGLVDMNRHPLWEEMYRRWKAKEENFFYHLKGEDLEAYYKALKSSANYSAPYIDEDPPEHFCYVTYFDDGVIFTFNTFQYSDEQKQILKRFASVFNLTYRRFLDLQRAETQAREAQIEAALEKVRGKAMAMHNSTDLSITASLVFTELRKLGISPIRCGVGLLSKDSRRGQLYSATSSADGDSLSLVGWVELSGHPVLDTIYSSWLKNEDYFPELVGEQLKFYYELLLKGLSVKVPDWQSGQKQYGTFLPITVGCLYAWSDHPYKDSEKKILKRFANIIDLTFRRYIELQQSEANAREAVKQAALDRIRADIASMRTTKDLDRITPLIWNELTILGIPFMRCGVFIMDDAQQLMHTFLSTRDGQAIAAFHLPYDTPGNVRQVLDSWHQKKKYTDHWNQSGFADFAQILVKQGAVSSPADYLNTIPPEGFYLHFLPFLQGMLYVGNTRPLKDDEIELIQHVADAFSTAYARYEDFSKLEVAKQQVDKALTDLKLAQTQLVQSEKMASLGELTAGIAHEIQNPLNFVNNFSEVSKELLDEMKLALDEGNETEAKEIANDLIQNLEKITHHGKRADAIVKGMLQHSRSSSGQKELTDINALCDEYLRLSYHGLRAKDKSFNATFKTEFDSSLPKVNIIPQDVGRVILNLLTNAFYVVNEKRKVGTANYEPTVTVKTRQIPGRIEIEVSDNGNGIPQNVLDKIFQPFFTTKPTGQGTGLGLSLSYDIITKGHGGELKVKTKEGEGSTFIIQIPTPL